MPPPVAPPPDGESLLRWLLLALALLLFSFPWLSTALQRASVAGVPMVLPYFFLVWGLLIAVAARLGHGEHRP